MTTEQTTLRDQLSAGFDAAEDDQGTTATAAATSTEGAETGETAEQAAQRSRDERGRFAKTAGEQGQQAQQPQEQTTQQPAPKQRPARLTTWKKEIADKYWDSLDPELAEYLHTREQQYAQGVSTYKQEYERLRPYGEALQPLMPLLQQNGLNVNQWLAEVGQIQQALALGTPEQKREMLHRLAATYGIQFDGNGNQGDPALGGLVRELNQLKSQLNHFRTAQEQAEQQRTQATVAQWSAGKPHFEKVRETMAQLLESGVATDLDNAYDKACRLHDDVWQSEQEARSRAAAEEQARQRKDAVAQARANTISSKGTTPTGAGKVREAKGLRAQLEAAAEELGGGARV